MTTTRRPAGGAGGAGENILARLDRDNDDASARPSRWPRNASVAAGVFAAVAAALVWMLAGTDPDVIQGGHEAPVMVATPSPAEPPLPSPAAAAPADPASPDPASLEPIPVLPMLADVVEKAPAAPAQHPPARAQRAPHLPRANPPRRPAAARPADPAVETDVALLSAILIHAPRHSAERAGAMAKCKLDKNCTRDDPLPAMLEAAE